MSTHKYVKNNLLQIDRELHEARVDLMMFTELQLKLADDAQLDDFMTALRNRLLGALTTLEATMITVDLGRVTAEEEMN